MAYSLIFSYVFHSLNLELPLKLYKVIKKGWTYKKYIYINTAVVLNKKSVLYFVMCIFGSPAHIKSIVNFSPGAVEDNRT